MPEEQNVRFVFEERASASPHVHLIWRTQSERAGSFTSTAGVYWEIVVAHYQGETSITFRGPETEAMLAPCPAETEFFGIQFKLGSFMPSFPAGHLVAEDLTLPTAARHSFWLNSTTWPIPTFANADSFVARLVHEGLLVREPVVEAVLQNRAQTLSLRSVQRRFYQATGLTHGQLCQIERAQQAAACLTQGISILDTVEQAGYADQPHLTRALRRFMGKTPVQIRREQGFV
ncbi:MAG: helix-turn-helix transcriptional regulator [Caldilineaceae bacterium]|nr:helix-turn-helix transcriptional regulator [Caldilineaceae bacterium]